MKNYTTEELEILMSWYTSPNNEYDYLTFEEYIEEAERQEVIEILLEEGRQ